MSVKSCHSMQCCLQLKSCQVINGDSALAAGETGVRVGEPALLLQDKALVGLSKVARSLENKREALIHELDSLHRSMPPSRCLS